MASREHEDASPRGSTEPAKQEQQEQRESEGEGLGAENGEEHQGNGGEHEEESGEPPAQAPIRRHITFQQRASEGTSPPSHSEDRSEDEGKRRGSSDAPESTIVFVCLNGEVTARPLLVDPKTLSSSAELLALITKTFSPSFGSATRLLTPEGSPIPTAPVLALPADNLVVACGAEAFRRLPYRLPRSEEKEREQSLSVPRSERDDSATTADPLMHSKMSRRKREDTNLNGVKSRILDNRFFQPPIQIFVLPNGDETGMPVRVQYTRKQVASLAKLLDMITDRLQLRLRHGSVTKLVTLDGRDVSDLESVRDGQFYVGIDRLPVRLPPFTLADDGTLVRRPQVKPPPRLTKLPTTIKGSPSAARAASNGSGSGSTTTPPTAAHAPVSAPAPVPGGSDGAAVGPASNPVMSPLSPAAVGRSPTELLSGLDLSSTAPRGRELGEAGAIKLVESLCEQLLHSEEDAAGVLERLALLLRDKAQVLRGGYPEACTAYDDRVEEILTIMMRTGGDDAVVKEADIRERFEVAVLAAVAGRLAHWELSPMPFVALVILLDQFPRTIYKGTADTYVGDAIACQVVMRAIFKSKIMDEVHPVYRLFPCLALSHQEDLEMQRLCVSEWARATQYFEADDPIMSYTSVFKHNYETIKKFGRFPDRNTLLNRKSTDEERAVLGDEVPRAKPNVMTRLGRMRLFGTMAAAPTLKA